MSPCRETSVFRIRAIRGRLLRATAAEAFCFLIEKVGAQAAGPLKRLLMTPFGNPGLMA